jgi:outer membrane receptor protein involved in Fe transport
MNKTLLLGATALRTVAAGGLALALAGPAYAQDAQAPADQTAPVAQTEEQAPAVQPSEVELQSNTTADSKQEVIVTGSRIRRPNLESTVPVTSIGGEQLLEQGKLNVGDALNDLPQLRSTFSQQNPGLGVGIAGLNLLDLRGLGTQRTLVLVNGRRHVAADILNNAVSPDINTIPSDLIERVDIVTGGNSAIYGSDAIAGVVNFVLRRDFEGLQVRGQVSALAKGPSNGDQYVSAMYGKNFAEDRANVTVHAEYFNQSRVFGSDLPWLRSVNGLAITDVDPGSAANGSDGIPDRTFLRDIRSVTINRFGLIPITQNSSSTVANPACGRGISATAPSAGLAYNCTYLFDQTGTLSAQSGTRFGSGITGGILGGNGQTGREDDLLSIRPEMQRYNVNLLAHYTISDAFEPFVELKWNRVDTLGSNASPSFIQGQQTQFDTRERIRLDNPFLTTEQRTTIANAIIASGCRPSLTATCNSTPATGVASNLLTAGDITNINNGSFRFVLARQLDDIGIRDEDFQRDTFRIVGGARGTFNDDWSYEISLNYGQFKEDTTTAGYVDRQRFMLSLDAGRNPLTGQIQCRSQFDPASANPFPNTPENAARLAADIAACVPYNPFGGTDNNAAADYFSYSARHKASLRQFDFLAFMSGDSSEFLNLPGGPIRFALGGEYRREKADYINDPFVESGATNAVVIGRFDPDAFEVAEAFGEVQLPILKDTPFFEELTASGAARISDYDSAVGTVWTYNAGLDWSPIRDIRFRGNYSRALRAPNLSETGFPPVANFAPGFADPCNSQNIGNNPNRNTNCQTDLGSLLAGLPTGTYSLPIISGSSSDLDAEKSDSWTVGFVAQPRFVPGLSLSVDYYKIKVKNVIVSLTAQAIVNACYDQPDLNNMFCGMFERYRGSTPTPSSSPGGVTQPGQVLANSLLSSPINFAARVRRGIDLNLAYRRALGGDVRLDTSLIYTHNLETSNFENPALPKFENRILGELGDPKDEFQWYVDLTKGIATVGYKMHYIGPMWTGAFEDFNELDSACSTSGCPPFNSDYADIRKYPETFYHDIRAEVDLKNVGLAKGLNVYGGVNNLFNTHAPLGLAGTGTGGTTDRGTGNAAIYDALGRVFYIGAKAKF